METFPETFPNQLSYDTEVLIMKRKGIALVATAVMMGMAVLSGCSGKTADSSKGSVYYLNFKPEADAQWQELASIYTKETGVNVLF